MSGHMNGHWRFLQTRAGITYFAEIWLSVQTGGQQVEVVDALPQSPASEQGEVNSRTASSWVAAARNGILEAVAHAQQIGDSKSGCRVVLEKLVGSFVDTRDDVVYCAAGLAVWSALAVRCDGIRAEFDGKNWRLLFAVPVNGGAATVQAARSEQS